MMFSFFPEKIREKRKEFLKGILSKHVSLQEASLLDIGCGPGRYGDIFRELVNEYVGIDPNKESRYGK